MEVIIIKIIRHKTPTEECFVSWIRNYREGYHPCDEKRFYQFVHCIFSYNSTSWLKRVNLEKEF